MCRCMAMSQGKWADVLRVPQVTGLEGEQMARKSEYKEEERRDANMVGVLHCGWIKCLVSRFAIYFFGFAVNHYLLTRLLNYPTKNLKLGTKRVFFFFFGLSIPHQPLSAATRDALGLWHTCGEYMCTMHLERRPS